MNHPLPIRQWLMNLGSESNAFQVKESRKRIDASGSVPWDCRFALQPLPPDGHSFDLLVEAKRRLSPQVAVELLPRLRANAAGAVPTLACPFISPRVAAMCRESNVSYFDADGNAYIRGPHFLLHVAGRPRQHFQEPEGTADIYAPKSSRIVRMLLSAPQRPWGVLELAKKAAISNGLASRVKDALLKEAFIEEAREGIRVRKPRELLEAWQARYEPAGPMYSYYLMGTPHEVERRVTDWCERRNVPHALALFSAAARVAPMVRYNRATVYLDVGEQPFDQKEFEKELNAKAVDSGANLGIVPVNDPAVFFGALEVDSMRVLSPLQLYLDLSRQAGRGTEAAEEIFDRGLRALFEQVSARENR